MPQTAASSDLFLGIFEGHADPAVALVQGGKVLAYSEEERHLRYKHAFGLYPSRALKYCLDHAGAGIEDVRALAVNWDCDAYADGRMEAVYKEVRSEWPVDSRTVAWQGNMLRRFTRDSLRSLHEFQLRKLFGQGKKLPALHPVPHHYVHAFQSALQSPFDESVCVTVDGSGDQYCTVVWVHRGTSIEPLRTIKIPHSLGWVYAAITEYLGFRAYDGEYKVMGLAAYGRPNPELRGKLQQIVHPAADNIDYRIDPTFIHYGAHTYSDRFTDGLVTLLGREPRLGDEPITAWHEDLAYATQENLEETVERLVVWAVETTGIRNVTIGGGVGLNIKMNSRLFQHPKIRDVFANPLCSDGGAAVGAALAACHEVAGCRPERLQSLAWGWQDSDAKIEEVLKLSLVDYDRPADICEAAAGELADGKVVGWFQGRMEAGPRALGQRSILADPRHAANRDRVNAIIKFREYWRPFCPSMLAEAAPRYFDRSSFAPFMAISFPANERLSCEAPAIVHVDGTSRVQFVDEKVLPQYHRLIKAFEQRTGVPVLLNTSFNIKGEPVVCTIADALRTFWATGIEVLAAGSFLVKKPRNRRAA